MTRFVKRSVLEGCKSAEELMKCDVTSADVMVRYTNLDVGVAAKRLIEVAKVSESNPLRS